MSCSCWRTKVSGNDRNHQTWVARMWVESPWMQVNNCTSKMFFLALESLSQFYFLNWTLVSVLLSEWKIIESVKSVVTRIDCRTSKIFFFVLKSDLLFNLDMYRSCEICILIIEIFINFLIILRLDAQTFKGEFSSKRCFHSWMQKMRITAMKWLCFWHYH